MLGVADTSGIYALLGNLAQRDMAAALVQAQSLLDAGVPASNVLDEIANIASRLAVFESAGAQPDGANDAQLAGLMGQFSPEHLQLLYGIALKAQSEIAYAPNAYAALAMPLLRMQVFAPSATGNKGGYASDVAPLAARAASVAMSTPAKTTAPLAAAPVVAVARVAAPPPPSLPSAQPLPPQSAAATNNATSSFILSNPEQWPAIANGLPLMSMARMAARESACTAIDGLNIHLALPTQQLTDKALISRVQDALRNLSGKAYVLHTTVVAVAANNAATATDTTFSQTASAVAHVQQVKVQNEAEQAFANDPLVKGLVSLGGQITPGSVKPVAPAND
jgi:DNA polymerase III gamma/tau subunit